MKQIPLFQEQMWDEWEASMPPRSADLWRRLRVAAVANDPDAVPQGWGPQTGPMPELTRETGYRPAQPDANQGRT